MMLHTTPNTEELTKIAQDILVEIKYDLVSAVKFSTSTDIFVYRSLGAGEYEVDAVSRNYPLKSHTRTAAFSEFAFDEAEVKAIVALLGETGCKFSRFQ